MNCLLWLKVWTIYSVLIWRRCRCIGETAGLVMYGQLEKDSILMKLGSLIEKMEHDDSYSREELVRAIYDEVYRLLDLSTTYGFDNNLWQCYIAYLLATTENPFSILCETVGASKDGTVNEIVKTGYGAFLSFVPL